MSVARHIVLLVTLVLIASTMPVGRVASAAATASCGGSSATVVGTQGDDQLRGTPKDDVIAGLGGDDEIRGLRGRDLLCGGEGRDLLEGGRGFDSLAGDDGDDRLHGGRGVDFFSPPHDRGRDVFDGGHGNDFLFFNKAPRKVVVDLARGFYRIGDRRERLVAGSFETVYGSHYADEIRGDDEHNVLFSGFESSGDIVRGRGGNDYLEGYEGTDALFGGDGDDVFSGLSGGDTVDGGSGRDLIRMCGHFSSNTSTCGNGSISERGVTIDLTSGTLTGAGEATLTGIEDVEGTATRDDITGSDDVNRIYGGPRADVLSGRGGDDVIFGDSYAPLPPPLDRRLNEGDVTGPDGSDSLDGGDGSDSLDGNGGEDTCVNGEQVDNCEDQSGPNPSTFHSVWSVPSGPLFLACPAELFAIGCVYRR